MALQIAEGMPREMRKVVWAAQAVRRFFDNDGTSEAVASDIESAALEGRWDDVRSYANSAWMLLVLKVADRRATDDKSRKQLRWALKDIDVLLTAVKGMTNPHVPNRRIVTLQDG